MNQTTATASPCGTPLETPPKRKKIKANPRGKAKEGQSQAPPSGLISLGDLLSLKLPVPEFLAAPWIQHGESLLLYGPTGQGKSLVAMTAALGAAGGGSVLGWTFPKPRKVLYVDGEMTQRTVQSRFDALQHSIAGFNELVAKSNLHLWQPHSFGLGLDLCDLHSQESLTATVDRLGVEAVFLDNLSTLSPSMKDENNAAEFKQLQSLLARLKSRGTSVVLVHHTGKSGASARGSSNLVTTFEVSLRVGRCGDLAVDSFEGQTPVEMQVEKFRGEPPKDLSRSSRWAYSSPSGRGHWRSLEEEVLAQPEHWETFSTGVFSTRAEFCKAIGKPPTRYSSIRKRWLKGGLREADIEAREGLLFGVQRRASAPLGGHARF